MSKESKGDKLQNKCRRLRHYERERAVIYRKYQKLKSELTSIKSTSFDNMKVDGTISGDIEEKLAKIIDQLNSYKSQMRLFDNKLSFMFDFAKTLNKTEKTLFNLFYIENQQVKVVCEELNVSRPTLVNYRKMLVKKYTEFIK
jgi:prefoldin subunit 5